MPRRSCWRAIAATVLVAGLSTPAVAEDVAVFAAASMKNALEADAAKWQALELSLRVSIVATAASLPFGILAAYALARWRFRGRQVLNVLVHLPLVLPGVIAGAILAFAKALGEFGATITFASNIPGQTQTLPTAIYTFLQVPGGEADAARLALVSVGMAMAALVLSKWLLRAVARRIAGT